jgi:sugar phosphate isomerase/epimerase
MLIGAMNHPAQDVIDEIRWMAEMGLEFVDLTLEPPCAADWKVDAAAVRAVLEEHNLRVVGHTAYYLPICSAFESVRRAAVRELTHSLKAFGQVGAKWMNLHPDRSAPLHERDYIIERNLLSLRELLDVGRDVGVGLMIENIPGSFNNARQLGQLLDPLPELGLHLDIGHTNLCVDENTTKEILDAYGARLRHVHLHDNKGGSADLHLPLGAGTMNVARQVKFLRDSGYDDTITLEVFSEDRHYLAYSRDILRRLWDEPEAAIATGPQQPTETRKFPYRPEQTQT